MASARSAGLEPDVAPGAGPRTSGSGCAPGRLAVVHDYLTQRGGAERVVLALLDAFPQARLATSVYNPDGTFEEFSRVRVETSPLNLVPAFRVDPRRALPLLAPIFSTMRLTDVDTVLCSSSGWAHGVRTDARKIVYCHNPPRWLYQTTEYADGHGTAVRAGLRAIKKPLIRWDQTAARSADLYIANSSAVRNRIEQTYGIDAPVLPPPVLIDPDSEQEPIPAIDPGYFLTVARGRTYKNTDVVIEAMRALPDERLVVVGPLPLGVGTPPPNVTALSDVSDGQLRWLYANCEALIAVAFEDFGLTPLEANVFGRPSLCLRRGGYLDSLAENVSGLFVDDLTPRAITESVSRLRAQLFSSDLIRKHADRFRFDEFARRLHAMI